MRDAGQREPIGVAPLEGGEQVAVRLRHAADQLGHQCLAGLQEGLQGHRLGGHPLEAVAKLVGDVLPVRRQHLVGRAVVAQQVDYERLTEVFRQPLVRHQPLGVEQVAWVLPVEGRDELPRPQVGVRLGQHFGEAELLLDAEAWSRHRSWAVPRSTGVTSILIWASRFSTRSLVKIRSLPPSTSWTRTPRIVRSR